MHAGGDDRSPLAGLSGGQLFVKWFALCYWTVVCLSCPVLSLTLVYYGQMVGWIKMPLGLEVELAAGHIVLDGDPAPKGAEPPNFRPMSVVPMSVVGGWIKMPLGREVGLSPGHIVLDGDPAPPPRKKGHSSPLVSAYVYCGQTVAHLSHC